MKVLMQPDVWGKEIAKKGGNQCLTHTLWSDLSNRIEEFLQSISLSELVEQRDVKSVSKRQDGAYKHANGNNLETLIETKVL